MMFDRNELRVILFSIFVYLVTFAAFILPIVAGQEAAALVSTVIFFLSFILYWVFISLFLSWEGRGETIEDLGLQWDNKSIHQLTIGVIAGGLASGLVVVIAFLFGGDLRPLSQITEVLIINEIIITVPVAFFEELAYRGYLMTRMEISFGKPAAIIVSSVVFSLCHFSWWTKLTPAYLFLIPIFAFNMFLGGVVLGYSYYLSGRKLWVPISFHFAWNMVSYILFPTFPIVPVSNPALFQIEWGLTTIMGFLFGLSILFMFLTEKKKKK
jgi:membrane protease YdiL (CAAX protease family)